MRFWYLSRMRKKLKHMSLIEFGLSFLLHQYVAYLSIECAGESVHLRSLASASVARECDKNQNINVLAHAMNV